MALGGQTRIQKRVAAERGRTGVEDTRRASAEKVYRRREERGPSLLVLPHRAGMPPCDRLRAAIAGSGGTNGGWVSAGAGARTANLDRRLQLKQDGLLHEDLTSCCAEAADLCLCEVDLLAWTLAAHLEELTNDGIDVAKTLGH